MRVSYADTTTTSAASSATRVRRVGESDVNVNAMASENRTAWIVPGGYLKCSNPGGSSRAPEASRTASSSVRVTTPIRVIGRSPMRRRTPRSRPRWRGPHREQQLVVVAPGEGAAHRVGPGRGVPGPGLVRDRQRGRVDLDADARGSRNLPQPVGEAVAEVHAARGRLVIRQLQAGLQARLGPKVARHAGRVERAAVEPPAAPCRSMASPAAASPTHPVT